MNDPKLTSAGPAPTKPRTRQLVKGEMVTMSYVAMHHPTLLSKMLPRTTAATAATRQPSRAPGSAASLAATRAAAYAQGRLLSARYDVRRAAYHTALGFHSSLTPRVPQGVVFTPVPPAPSYMPQRIDFGEITNPPHGLDLAEPGVGMPVSFLSGDAATVTAHIEQASSAFILGGLRSYTGKILHQKWEGGTFDTPEVDQAAQGDHPSIKVNAFQQFDVSISYSSKLPPGDYTGTLIVESPQWDQPVSIPLHVTIVIHEIAVWVTKPVVLVPIGGGGYVTLSFKNNGNATDVSLTPERLPAGVTLDQATLDQLSFHLDTGEEKSVNLHFVAASDAPAVANGPVNLSFNAYGTDHYGYAVAALTVFEPIHYFNNGSWDLRDKVSWTSTSLMLRQSDGFWSWTNQLNDDSDIVGDVYTIVCEFNFQSSSSNFTGPVIKGKLGAKYYDDLATQDTPYQQGNDAWISDNYVSIVEAGVYFDGWASDDWETFVKQLNKDAQALLKEGVALYLGGSTNGNTPQSGGGQ
jgi:hypothetical protein